MTPRFEAFFPFIVKWEGSAFEDDPDDSGGATKYGIDQRSHHNVDIRHLTEEQAKQIYWGSYWTKVHADDLPKGVGEVCMDIGVNNGTGRASKWLQQEVGTTPDGVIGPKTIQAAMLKGPSVADALLDRREEFYRDIAVGRMQKYLKGWLNRNNDLRRFVAELQKEVSGEH